jgi:hypothetical protein
MRIQHTARAAGEIVRQFTCDHCSFTTEARVRGFGVGSDTGRLGLDDGAAEINAYASAENEAVVDAETMLDVVPCPSCGRRDDNGFARYQRGTARLQRIAISLCVLAGTAVAVVLRIYTYPAIGAVVASALAFVAVHLERAKRLEQAKARVAFMDSPTVSDELRALQNL